MDMGRGKGEVRVRAEGRRGEKKRGMEEKRNRGEGKGDWEKRGGKVKGEGKK